eukprot:284988-Prorocentrum_minimum.AAC.1
MDPAFPVARPAGAHVRLWLRERRRTSKPMFATPPLFRDFGCGEGVVSPYGRVSHYVNSREAFYNEGTRDVNGSVGSQIPLGVLKTFSNLVLRRNWNGREPWRKGMPTFMPSECCVYLRLIKHVTTRYLDLSIQYGTHRRP